MLSKQLHQNILSRTILLTCVQPPVSLSLFNTGKEARTENVIVKMRLEERGSNVEFAGYIWSLSHSTPAVEGEGGKVGGREGDRRKSRKRKPEGHLVIMINLSLWGVSRS